MVVALKLLDNEIENHELLMSIAPIRLISIGGALAVRILKNRHSTFDIDCVLDPNISAVRYFAEEFDYAVSIVAMEAQETEDWLNQQMSMFIARNRREHLFLESVKQGIIVFQGDNLIIYAGDLTWALERKIRRVSYARDRRGAQNIDLTDAAALIHYMLNPAGDAKKPPLTAEYIRSLNMNGFDPEPTPTALKEVADFYRKAYGEEGIVGL